MHAQATATCCAPDNLVWKHIAVAAHSSVTRYDTVRAHASYIQMHAVYS
jgi:hypothetical protein